MVWAAEYSAEETEGFPVLLGMASESDLAATEQMRKTKARTMVASRKLIREHGLPMKVLAVDPQPSAGKTVIYYSSPETVDFRSLLRDLSATLDNRIELRQLAARDAVRVTGAIGSCGRDTCCSTFLKDYEPITLAMARDQDLPANPMRISGACGRLMCCLKYEHPLYQEFKATAPAIGEEVDSPAGTGPVDRPFGARRFRGDQAGRRRLARRCARRRRCAALARPTKNSTSTAERVVRQDLPNLTGHPASCRAAAGSVTPAPGSTRRCSTPGHPCRRYVRMPPRGCSALMWLDSENISIGDRSEQGRQQGAGGERRGSDPEPGGQMFHLGSSSRVDRTVDNGHRYSGQCAGGRSVDDGTGGRVEGAAVARATDPPGCRPG